MTRDMRSERIDLQLTPDAKRLPQHAAADMLADRHTFVLGEAQWQAFVAVLDCQPADNPGLCRLLDRRPAWDA